MNYSWNYIEPKIDLNKTKIGSKRNQNGIQKGLKWHFKKETELKLSKNST